MVSFEGIPRFIPSFPTEQQQATGWESCAFLIFSFFVFSKGNVSDGCGKPCTPGEHQNRWYMGVHPRVLAVLFANHKPSLHSPPENTNRRKELEHIMHRTVRLFKHHPSKRKLTFNWPVFLGQLKLYRAPGTRSMWLLPSAQITCSLFAG